MSRTRAPAIIDRERIVAREYALLPCDSFYDKQKQNRNELEFDILICCGSFCLQLLAEYTLYANKRIEIIAIEVYRADKV